MDPREGWVRGDTADEGWVYNKYIKEVDGSDIKTVGGCPNEGLNGACEPDGDSEHVTKAPPLDAVCSARHRPLYRHILQNPNATIQNAINARRRPLLKLVDVRGVARR
jgi:hypothetical protein